MVTIKDCRRARELSFTELLRLLNPCRRGLDFFEELRLRKDSLCCLPGYGRRLFAPGGRLPAEPDRGLAVRICCKNGTFIERQLLLRYGRGTAPGYITLPGAPAGWRAGSLGTRPYPYHEKYFQHQSGLARAVRERRRNFCLIS